MKLADVAKDIGDALCDAIPHGMRFVLILVADDKLAMGSNTKHETALRLIERAREASLQKITREVSGNETDSDKPTGN